jgi:hypothetical protein
MPINDRSGVLPSNCERFAISLGNETHLGSIWLFYRDNLQIRAGGINGLISLAAARRQTAGMTKETAGMPALDIVTP